MGKIEIGAFVSEDCDRLRDLSGRVGEGSPTASIWAGGETGLPRKIIEASGDHQLG